MRIDLTGKSPESRQAEGASQPKPRVGSNPRDRSTIGEDKAQLSLDQGRIRDLEWQAKQLPEVRSERIKALAQKLESGAYEVTPQQTAEAMLSEMLRRPPLR
ncbi:MAG TPA: flagellar biosynthesis anti-sigma factor FlgM [Terriglobales bacterium]|nr:flagellar biosynthesis anti-sigma factor FlgM [Terriglobales bacterium]